jgi:PIN domain nuclease of toxin-antitoxin system
VGRKVGKTGQARLNVAYIDTHVAVWLHDGRVKKLTRAAQREFERREIRISPMVYLELDNLLRNHKVRYPPDRIYAKLNRELGVTLCDLPFIEIAKKAVDLGWTTEPFDRIIVAHAWANDESVLITADEQIREHYRQAVW